MEHGGFQSKTLFYAPIWAKDYASFTALLRKDGRYLPLEKNEEPQYMLPYITAIYKSDDLYAEFLLKEEYLPNLCMYDWCLEEGCRPRLEGLRIACFATGCAFAEFCVSYEGMDPYQIADFSFRFKRAKKGNDWDPAQEKMMDALGRLMPVGADVALFFTATDFKCECKMFHQIRLEEAPTSEALEEHLVQLRRGYHRNFPVPNCIGDQDMTFEPYTYDHWAGSQEGLVNIFHTSGNEAADDFLINYKPRQLAQNYRFMYLVLLNQRFSAVRYLEEISRCKKDSPKQLKALNQRTSQLKTVFSFSVVSDDGLYQEVYTRMYAALGIDRLLEDIRDNESQVELLQTHEILESERMSGNFLAALSILSLSSVLVDAASYIDRVQAVPAISTLISAGLCAGLLVWYFIWRHRFINR